MRTGPTMQAGALCHSSPRKPLPSFALQRAKSSIFYEMEAPATSLVLKMDAIKNHTRIVSEDSVQAPHPLALGKAEYGVSGDHAPQTEQGK